MNNNNLYFNSKSLEINTKNIDLNVKNIKIVSLFSGCGGMDLGFKGDFTYLNQYYESNPVDLVFANDIFEAATKVYEHNFKHKADLRSITELPFYDIPSADLVLGGFPCQDFSLAGKGEGLTSERGRLYQHMIEVIKHCDAKMFVAENVDGIRMNKKHDVDTSALDTILADFEKAGFVVQFKVLNAADYGVPQLRKRVIIIGVRKDIYNGIFYPKSTHSDNANDLPKWRTSKDAIDDLWDKINDENILNHSDKDYSRAKFYPGKKMQGNNQIQEYRPSCTIRAEHHGNIEAHYRSNNKDNNDMNGWRRLSIRECARLQSFPDEFHFNVSASAAYKMIGNAVPPVLGWHIARAAIHTLNQSLVIEDCKEKQLVLNV